MATIEKRNNSYRITVSMGYDMEGKQVKKRMTWTPDQNMTEKQIQKELTRQTVLFEERCQAGQILDGSIRFAEFSEIWMQDYAYQQLRPKTLARYRDMLKRINAGIGHIRLEKLRPNHLMAFYANLAENGIRRDARYHYPGNFKGYLQDRGMKKVELAQKAGVSVAVLNSLTSGKNISKATGDKVAAAIGEDPAEFFEEVGTASPLSNKTILHHHRLISSILSTAVKWQVIFSNPCERVSPPKVEQEEANYLDEEGAARLLACLDEETEQNRAIVTLFLYTGLRRGELCGLEWPDIDFDRGVLTISRSSLYLPEKGVFTDETKNATSMRSIKLSADAVQILRRHKAWQAEYAFSLGDQWKASNRIFTNYEGAPINPDTISSWFHRFIQKNDLPDISIHSLRHTNATLLIAAGTNLQTVANRLGHANVTTTGRIYAHAIRSADAAAADTLQDLLHPVKHG